MMKKLILAIALLGALATNAAHAAAGPSIAERIAALKKQAGGKKFIPIKPKRPAKPARFGAQTTTTTAAASAQPKPARPAKPNFLRVAGREMLNADEDETFTLYTFSELIAGATIQNPFVLARVTSLGENNREYVHYYDANSFDQYREQGEDRDPLNRQIISKIEYYTISPGQKTFTFRNEIDIGRAGVKLSQAMRLFVNEQDAEARELFQQIIDDPNALDHQTESAQFYINLMNEMNEEAAVELLPVPPTPVQAGGDARVAAEPQRDVAALRGIFGG